MIKMTKKTILLFIFLLQWTAYSQEKYNPPDDISQLPDLAWKYSLGAPVYSSPVISEQTVYFGCLDSIFYALDLESGDLKWSFKTGGEIRSTCAIKDNMICFTSGDGKLYCLDKSGKVLWKFKTVGHRFFPEGKVQGNPAISGELVIVGSRDYNVYALDAKEGYCHWNRAFLRGWVLSNTVKDSLLFMAGADEQTLTAVDAATGKMLWKQDMEFLQFGNVTFSRNMLYTGTTNGKVHGMNISTGKKVWTFSTDGYRQNRLKYFKEDDSYRDDIYSIITSNEQFLEVEHELGGIFSSPAVVQGYLVFTSTEGSVYCLKSKNIK